MTKTTPYTLEQKNRSPLRPINGKKVTSIEGLLSFTIENVESVLREQFQEITITENEWSRKKGQPSYAISVEVHKMQTMEQIKDHLFGMFKTQPVGGHRNYESPDRANLFLYYCLGSEKFYLKFSNIVSPFKKE